MDFVQIKVNVDDTICLDIYSDNPFESGFSDHAVSLCEYVAFKTGTEIRNHPFRIGRCRECNQWIMSNRDRYEEFLCQNCHKEIVLDNDERDESLRILNLVAKKRKVQIKRVAGQNAFMLIIFQETPDEDSLKQIFDLYGFTQCSEEENLLEFTMLLAQVGMSGFPYKPTLPSIFCSAKMNDDDVKYNGLIPRIEECDRLIRRTFPETCTVSCNVPNVSPRTREKMMKLIQKGRFDKVNKLMKKQW